MMQHMMVGRPYDAYAGRDVEPTKHSRDKGGKKAWTADEDQQIIALVAKLGCKHWSKLAKMMRDENNECVRSGKQCRERWHNHLDSTIKKGPWSKEEEDLLVRAHKEHGNQWSKIAKLFHGRTDNAIKNRWFAKQRRESRRTNKSGSAFELSSDGDDVNLTPRPTRPLRTSDTLGSPKHTWISPMKPEPTPAMLWNAQGMTYASAPWRSLHQADEMSSFDLGLMEGYSFDYANAHGLREEGVYHDDDFEGKPSPYLPGPSFLELDLDWTDKVLI
ncbi:Myb-related protein [Achlya hypogyna]|uniref:Myb-related protein n=1 Tax=Achlya hypogyna TaxID=1202772 RepID=A0A1V9ZGD9_ACHHY|nr:Myb-related protein [Achlya hypogyna]